MNIDIVVFDRITVLDAIGPYEVLSRIPGARIRWVGKQRGQVLSDNKMLKLQVEHAFEDIDDTDLLLMPGGIGTDLLVQDAEALEWLRVTHARSTWTTSVCTGALVLGAAGILNGLPATTHWARMEELASYGATPMHERAVWSGKVVTAAGVSAGIDMALALAARIAGEGVAQMIQLGIEYDPAPPFDAGSPLKAPAPLVAKYLEMLAERRKSLAAR